MERIEVKLNPDNYKLFIFNSYNKLCGIENFIRECMVHGDFEKICDNKKIYDCSPYRHLVEFNVDDMSVDYNIIFSEINFEYGKKIETQTIKEKKWFGKDFEYQDTKYVPYYKVINEKEWIIHSIEFKLNGKLFYITANEIKKYYNENLEQKVLERKIENKILGVGVNDIPNIAIEAEHNKWKNKKK